MVTNPLQGISFPPQDLPPPPLLTTRRMARVKPQKGPIGEILFFSEKRRIVHQESEGPDRYEPTGTCKVCLKVDLAGVKPRVGRKGAQNIGL